MGGLHHSTTTHVIYSGPVPWISSSTLCGDSTGMRLPCLPACRVACSFVLWLQYTDFGLSPVGRATGLGYGRSTAHPEAIYGPGGNERETDVCST